MADATEARAFEELSGHPRFAELVSLAKGVALRALEARSLVWRSLVDSAPEAERGTLTESEAQTDFGNAWSVLERGPRTNHERALTRALFGHVVAETRPSSPEGGDALAEQVAWLAANTPFDATLLLDRALGDGADSFWPALGERLQRLDAGEIPTDGRAEPLAIAHALRASSSPAAEREVRQLALRINDPLVQAVLGKPARQVDVMLRGELGPRPRHPAATVALAVTGVLLVVAVFRVVLRFVFAMRRPAEVVVSSTAVRIRSRVLVLGRTVRERETVIPRSGLVRADREVRYARVGFYAGLVALTLGSLVGVHIFVDGVRSASPSLLFLGAVVIALGVGLDFVLSSLAPGLKGRCRLVLVPSEGREICIGDVDGKEADAALVTLARAPDPPGG